MIYVMIASEADIRELIWQWKRSRRQNINNVLNITVTFKHSLPFSVAVQWNDLDFQIFRYFRFSKYKNFLQKSYGVPGSFLIFQSAITCSATLIGRVIECLNVTIMFETLFMFCLLESFHFYITFLLSTSLAIIT